MKHKPRICISSPPDREKLVAEIFFGDAQWAELNQEGEAIEAIFYPRPDGEPWHIDYEDACRALDEAKRRLIGPLRNAQSEADPAAGLTGHPIAHPSSHVPMKAWCPRCNQGWFLAARIKATSETVAVCEECEATWIEGKPIVFETYVDMSTMLKAKGLSGTWSDLNLVE